MITERIASLRSEVASGVPVTDAVRGEERPLIVELITQNVEALHSVGSRLRWAEARALQAEGLTVTAIAELFGVTRQRVSALLQDPPKSVQNPD
jgi:predicted transcriptional regulator